MTTPPTNTPVGGIVFGSGEIEINAGRPRVTLKVRNTGDRPIQVGSHFHFFEVNRALEFDRPAAFGMRLDISASTAVRFEPGDEKEVTLVPYRGKQMVFGFNGLVDNWTGSESSDSYTPGRTEAIRRANELGFKSAPEDATPKAPAALKAAPKATKPTVKK